MTFGGFMKALLIICVLLGLGFAFDSGAVSPATAAAAKCDYAKCMQTCNANRGRYCAAACKRCL